jgi:hypothetical protein
MLIRFALLVALVAPAPAFAQQLVTFDQVVTITERGNGAGAFHHLIKPAPTEPASWTTPVDYSKGTAHVHLEVMEKPSKRNTAITICFDGNLEGYGCIGTSAYTDVGTYQTTRALPTATWQYDKIAWGKRRQEYHLVVKDPALGGTPGGRPASDYVPTKMRIVMTIVPPGGMYTPPAGSAAPAPDAGADPGSPPDAGADPGSPPDAAPTGGVTGPQEPPTTSPPAPAPPPAPAAPPAPAPAAPPPPAVTPPLPAVTPPPPAPASGGCSVARTGTGVPALALLALVAAPLAAWRRRRR